MLSMPRAEPVYKTERNTAAAAALLWGSERALLFPILSVQPTMRCVKTS